MNPDQILESVLGALNDALARDPEAVNALMQHSVRCNAALGDHPTVQCLTWSNMVAGEEEKLSVRALGLINGIVEPLCGQRVMAVHVGDTDQIAFFARYLGLD